MFSYELCQAANGSREGKSDGVLDKFDVSHECARFDFTVYTVIMGSLCIFGLTGNTAAFVVMLRDREQSSTTFLLRTLAVVDSLVLITTIPLYVLPNIYPYTGFLHGYHHVYLTIVPYLWPVYLIPYTATIWLTVLVSFNRYLAVCMPFRTWGRLRGSSDVRHHVIYLAALSAIYNIPRFFEYHSKEICVVGQNSTKEVFELSDFGDNKIYRILYANVLYFIVVHGGPLLSLAFLNVKLIATLKVRQQKRAAMGKANSCHQHEITLMLVVIICVFIISQTPTFIDHILWTAISDRLRRCGNWHYYYTAVADTTAVINSAVNFIIYTVTSRKFRRGLITSCVFNDVNRRNLARLEMSIVGKSNFPIMEITKEKE